MINKEKRTYIMVIWTLCTAVLLTMTSYAWFSTNRILTVKTFKIHVASKGGIEISTDAINWKAVLTLTDLIDARKKYPSSINQIPDVLEPVSSAGNIENGFLKLFHGEVSNDGSSVDYLLSAKRSVEKESFGLESEGKFVAFDLFFKTINKKTIYLTAQSGISYLSEVSTGIENAFRVAFLNQGNLPSSSAVKNIQELKNATKSYIWEPNYDTHTAYGVAHASSVYQIVTTETNGKLLEYHGITNEIECYQKIKVQDANALKHPNYFQKVKTDIATVKNFSNFEPVFTLEPGVTKVRIYIWIEGQDVDCEDNALIADIAINLQITTEPI